MAGLRSLLFRSGFSLASFDLAPLDFDTDGGEAADEPLVDRPVVIMRAGPPSEPQERPRPTPGELRARIEHHLHGGVPARVPAVDAATELRQALSKLRRSLGQVTLRR